MASSWDAVGFAVYVNCECPCSTLGAITYLELGVRHCFTASLYPIINNGTICVFWMQDKEKGELRVTSPPVWYRIGQTLNRLRMKSITHIRYSARSRRRGLEASFFMIVTTSASVRQMCLLNSSSVMCSRKRKWISPSCESNLTMSFFFTLHSAPARKQIFTYDWVTIQNLWSHNPPFLLNKYSELEIQQLSSTRRLQTRKKGELCCYVSNLSPKVQIRKIVREYARGWHLHIIQNLENREKQNKYASFKDSFSNLQSELIGMITVVVASGVCRTY